MQSHAYLGEYLELVRHTLTLWEKTSQKPPRLLKMDVHNEVNVVPHFRIAQNVRDRCKSITLVELDKGLVEVVQKECANICTVKHGDIRNLWAAGIKPASKEILVDLSTIDYVAEYGKVIQDYAQVLVPGGYLVLVAWTTAGEKVEERKGQYYLPASKLRYELLRAFKIVEESFIDPGYKSIGLLKRYICRKEGK